MARLSNLFFQILNGLILTATASFVFAQSGSNGNTDEVVQGTLEEVIVTALKREENLQKTAAAITVLNADTLVEAGISDIRAAQMLLPSVRFQEEQANTEIYIRGVGSTLDLPQFEPPTAFNFNGIYIPREANSVPFFDIESLELLPGPQGTLYGRSSIGGTVNVNFKRPTPENETNFLLEAGNYQMVHATAVLNTPLTDNWSARIAADYGNHDGYMTSGANSKDDVGARLSFLYEPGEDLSVYIWAFAVNKDGTSPNLVNKGTNPTTFAFDENAYLRPDPYDDSRPGALAVLAPFGQAQAEDQNYKNYMFGAQIDWQLGDKTLTYIPSYLYLDWESDYWIGALPAFLGAHYNAHSHELRLTGDSDKWNWLVGVNGYRVENRGNFLIVGGWIQNVTNHTLQGVGVFGQATYDFSDVLRTTIGARFSYDDRSGEGREALATPVLGDPYKFDKNYNSVDFKLGVEYDTSDEVMLYANIETGYQPGTFNPFPSTPTLDNSVKEADLIAYSVGFKSRMLDNRLQINNEAFYYDYTDLFAQAFNASTGKVATFNADKIEIYGNQLDILFQMTGSDRLNLAIGYLHARQKKFVLPGIGGVDLSGLQMQYAPDWTIAGGYQHDFRLSTGDIKFRVDTRYESSFFGDFFHTPGTRQDNYIKTDASLTYYADANWSVGLWVKNIEDEAVLAATAAAGIPGPASPFLESPRTYGVRFTYFTR